MKRAREPSDKSQYGDPAPAREDQGGTPHALTVDELLGKGGGTAKGAVKTGPIASYKICGLCREKVTGAYCEKCTKNPPPLAMARNSNDPTLQRQPLTVTNDVRLPWMRSFR